MGTPALDVVFSGIVTEGKGFVNFKGTASGDGFPSTELFVEDAGGHRVFLGASKEKGDVLTLYGGADKKIINFNLTIQVDSDGVFQKVLENGKPVDIEVHNNKVKEEFKQSMKVITSILFFLTLYSCNSTKFENEILILPKDYSGHVVVFYSQKNTKGRFEEKEGNLYTYVPKDGIVFSKYQYSDAESIEILNISVDKKNISANSGKIYLPNEVEYSVHYIGTKKELDTMEYLDYKKLKSIYLGQ